MSLQQQAARRRWVGGGGFGARRSWLGSTAPSARQQSQGACRQLVAAQAGSCRLLGGWSTRARPPTGPLTARSRGSSCCSQGTDICSVGSPAAGAPGAAAAAAVRGARLPSPPLPAAPPSSPTRAWPPAHSCIVLGEVGASCSAQPSAVLTLVVSHLGHSLAAPGERARAGSTQFPARCCSCIYVCSQRRRRPHTGPVPPVLAFARPRRICRKTKCCLAVKGALGNQPCMASSIARPHASACTAAG